MKIMRAALHKVAEMPRDELEEGVKIWAGELRELSYNMEDVVDKFLVHVNGESSDPMANSNKLNWLGDNMIGLFTKWKACHQIANDIKDIKNQVNYVAKQHKRYKVNGVVAANVAATTTLDPRLPAMYNKVSDLVGINEPRDELIKRLTTKNDQIEIVCIVGFGGLGKTTLAKAVYDSLKSRFDCTAFISVSQSPDMVRIFKKMLYQLDKQNYAHINEASRDATELIDELRMFLRNKRYRSYFAFSYIVCMYFICCDCEVHACIVVKTLNSSCVQILRNSCIPYLNFTFFGFSSFIFSYFILVLFLHEFYSFCRILLIINIHIQEF
jgi:CO dehydrogenase nickel-insertion accessory protein CooC1